MNTNTPPSKLLNRSLGDIVAERPVRAMVLERLGIDYCCKGGRSLRLAADSIGLDPHDIAEALAAIVDDAGAGVDQLGPVQLIDHILTTHHRYLHEELPALVELAQKVVAAHGERHQELSIVAVLIDHLHDDLQPHLAREELVLFPAIVEWTAGQRSFPFGTLANPIRVMLVEHDLAGDLLRDLRAATNDYTPPADACLSYRALYGRLQHLEADTRRHIHLENNVLFPAVSEAV